MRVIAVLVALAAAGPAIAAPGTPVCVDRREIRSLRPADDGALRIRTVTGREYRGELASACPFRRNFDRFENRSTAAALCEGETLQVVDNTAGAYRASCQLGRITAVRR